VAIPCDLSLIQVASSIHFVVSSQRSEVNSWRGSEIYTAWLFEDMEAAELSLHHAVRSVALPASLCIYEVPLDCAGGTSLRSTRHVAAYDRALVETCTLRAVELGLTVRGQVASASLRVDQVVVDLTVVSWLVACFQLGDDYG